MPLSSRPPTGWARETVRTAAIVLAIAGAAGLAAALRVLGAG